MKERLLEKSDAVLWAFTPQGIILHNFRLGLFLELDGVKEEVWAFLDGVHTVDSVVAELSERGHDKGKVQETVNVTVADLLDGGFLVERAL